jgi:hypothetical protein
MSELYPGLDPEQQVTLSRVATANHWNEERLFREALRSFLRGVEVTAAYRQEVC